MFDEYSGAITASRGTQDGSAERSLGVFDLLWGGAPPEGQVLIGSGHASRALVPPGSGDLAAEIQLHQRLKDIKLL